MSKLTVEQQNLYEDVLNTFEDNNQIAVAIEEMAELIQELSYILSGRLDKQGDIIKEIADNYVMLNQMKVLFGCDQEVEFRVKKIEEGLATKLLEAKF
jgi:hypothetical protein